MHNIKYRRHVRRMQNRFKYTLKQNNGRWKAALVLHISFIHPLTATQRTRALWTVNVYDTMIYTNKFVHSISGK